MKTLISIICVIALTSIIFGVTMHEAFWGIVAFIFIILGIVVVVKLSKLGVLGLQLGVEKIDKKIEAQKRKTKKQKEEELHSFLLATYLATTGIAIMVVIAAIFSFMLYGDLSFGIGH